MVIPELPGFGWSGKPKERGWGISRIAAALHPSTRAEASAMRSRTTVESVPPVPWIEWHERHR